MYELCLLKNNFLTFAHDFAESISVLIQKSTVDD